VATLVNEIDARIQAWRNALDQLPAPLHWDRAMQGQCDAFALMLGDHMGAHGIGHSFAVITRSTTSEDGSVDVNHFSHAVVVTEDGLGRQLDFDATGSDAINRFMNDWVDEPGCDTQFDEIHFLDAPDFLAYLSSPLPNYGPPKSNATDEDMLKVWRSAWAAQSIQDAPVNRGLSLLHPG
jgi:hypothetical protein